MGSAISKNFSQSRLGKREETSVSSSVFEPKSTSNYVDVSVLPSGSLTLPEHFFCTDQHDKSVRNTVPSMSFLLQHKPSKRRIIFDLGIRKDLSAYPSEIQPHLQTRLPIVTTPDTSDSLRAGGLEPRDIDMIILSHVHYDHVGTPRDFDKAKFIVGYGTRHLLQHGMKYHSAAHFDKDLLPQDRIIELPVQTTTPSYSHPIENSFPPTATLDTVIVGVKHEWKPLSLFPNAIDIFGDNLVYIIDSPGHLTGHLNLLARVSSEQWIYLGGDACHHSRILEGKTDMATWEENGQTVCIHAEKELAFETVGRIKRVRSEGVEGAKVEVVLAHDGKWLEDHSNAVWPNVFI